MDASEPLIEFRNVYRRFGTQEVLRDVSFTIHRGESVAIIGESGCGKSVTLKLMIALLAPSSGEVLLDGRSHRTRSEKDLTRERLRFGYVFQQAALFDSMSVEDNVAFGLRQNTDLSESEIGAIIRERLNEVGLPLSIARKKPAELSGGMKKRVGLARALALSPEIVLYDEPTTGLDPIMSDVINELIVQARDRRPITGIVVTHDMVTVGRTVERVIMLYPLPRLEARPNHKSFSTEVRAPRSFLPRTNGCISSFMDRRANGCRNWRCGKEQTMNERQLQFRVGLLVVMAGVVAAGLVFRFGEMRWLWEKHYTLGVHFDRAPGVERGTPVRKNGILIGSVRAVSFDESRGGVNVIVEIRERFKLRKDSLPMLSRSLLGDATLEFDPGKSREILRPGDRIEGGPSADPMEMIARMESKANQTLDSFAATSEEWGKVGKNLNDLADTHRGQLDQVIEETAESLHQFTITMRSLNKTVADPQAQENLRKTLAALPQMMEETQLAVQAFRSAAGKADVALGNLTEVTAPLAKRSNSIAIRLDHSIASLETLLGEMALFSKSINSENGSLSLFA